MLADQLEQFLKLTLRTLSKQGVAAARQRAVAAGWVTASAIRNTLILHYCILVLCFLIALSLFASLYLAAAQVEQDGSMSLTVPMIFSILVLGTCLILLGLSIRKRTWNKALQIESWVDAVLGTGRVQESHTAPPLTSQQTEALSTLLDSLIDEKLSTLVRQTREKSETTRSTEPT